MKDSDRKLTSPTELIILVVAFHDDVRTVVESKVGVGKAVNTPRVASLIVSWISPAEVAAANN